MDSDLHFQLAFFHSVPYYFFFLYEEIDEVLSINPSASICSTMTFPPMENPGYMVVSVSIDFLSNSKYAPFCCIAYVGLPQNLENLEDLAKC